MHAKWMLTAGVSIVLVVLVLGCASKKNNIVTAGEDQDTPTLIVTLKAVEDRIETTVTDGKGNIIPPQTIRDPANPLGALPGEPKITAGRSCLEVSFARNSDCLCRWAGGHCQCTPSWCVCQ
jgi:hypothetical protein